MLIKYAKLFSDAKVAKRATAGAIGFDVHAYHVVDKFSRERCGELPAKVMPGGSILIGTGIVFAVPFPVDCEIRPRSGLASKFMVQLLNSPGTLDPDYRGEAGILLLNLGEEPFTIEKGMRIAQLLFKKVEIPHFMEVSPVSALPPTKRDTGGFGSTGFGEIALGDEEYIKEQEKWDRYFMTVAIAASSLSNCLRGAEKDADGRYLKDAVGKYCGATRLFGCVIIKNRNIIAQGFNSRTIECDEKNGCVREREHIPSGQYNDKGCFHAEIAAIQSYASTGGASLQEAAVYVNAEPCLMCAKVLLGCGISAVVVPQNVYPINGLSLILEAGIEVRHV